MVTCKFVYLATETFQFYSFSEIAGVCFRFLKLILFSKPCLKWGKRKRKTKKVSGGDNKSSVGCYSVSVLPAEPSNDRRSSGPLASQSAKQHFRTGGQPDSQKFLGWAGEESPLCSASYSWLLLHSCHLTFFTRRKRGETFFPLGSRKCGLQESTTFLLIGLFSGGFNFVIFTINGSLGAFQECRRCYIDECRLVL